MTHHAQGVFPGDVADTSTSAAISWSPTVGCPPIPGTVQVAPWLLQHQSFVLPPTSEEGHLKYPKPSLPAFKDVVIPANAGPPLSKHCLGEQHPGGYKGGKAQALTVPKCVLPSVQNNIKNAMTSLVQLTPSVICWLANDL